MPLDRVQLLKCHAPYLYIGNSGTDYELDTSMRAILAVAFGLRPRLFGCMVRPRRPSSCARNCLPPQGRPVRVVVRMRATSSSYSVRSHCAQSSTTPDGGKSFDSTESRIVWQGAKRDSSGDVPAAHCRDSPGNGPRRWSTRGTTRGVFGSDMVLLSTA